MPQTKKQPESVPQHSASTAVNGGQAQAEVLNLAEAAGYLRLSEADVLRLVSEQRLPARPVGDEWRFLKTAIQQWLSTPLPKGGMEGIWAAAGSWKGDLYLDELLTEIHRRRGRPVAKE